MCNWNVQLYCIYCAGGSAVHISSYYYQIRFIFQKYIFISFHDPGSLLAMRSASYFQIFIRNRHLQIIEEKLTHTLIIVLSCMYQFDLKFIRKFGKLFIKRSHLHKIWSGSYYQMNFFLSLLQVKTHINKFLILLFHFQALYLLYKKLRIDQE